MQPHIYTKISFFDNRIRVVLLKTSDHAASSHNTPFTYCSIYLFQIKSTRLRFTKKTPPFHTLQRPVHHTPRSTTHQQKKLKKPYQNLNSTGLVQHLVPTFSTLITRNSSNYTISDRRSPHKRHGIQFIYFVNTL